MIDALLVNVANAGEQPRFNLLLDSTGAVVMDDDFFSTAIITSLFTWARLTDDEAAAADAPAGGYWGSAVTGTAGDNWGSKIRLLKRAKAIRENLALAREYAEESLAWLIDDGYATSVQVETSSPMRDVLFWDIDIDGRKYRLDRSGIVRVM